MADLPPQMQALFRQMAASPQMAQQQAPRMPPIVPTSVPFPPPLNPALLAAQNPALLRAALSNENFFE